MDDLRVGINLMSIQQMFFASLSAAAGSDLWGWGKGENATLGNNTTDNVSSPVQIGDGTTWATLSVQNFVVAVDADGKLWAWGFGGNGRLGNGATVEQSSPIQIGTLTDWAMASGGSGGHSLAVKTDGTLWAWGNRGQGRVGDGTNPSIDVSSPIQIGTLTNWASVVASSDHSLAVKTDGTLWAWGDRGSGRVGDGTDPTKDVSSPIQIGSDTDWSSVSAYGNSSFAVKTDGTLWSWGDNGQGELGTGTAPTTDVSSPVQIGGLTTWASVSAGDTHVVALKTDDTMWVWGNGAEGRTGQSDTVDVSSPIQIGTLTTWASISAGFNHSTAIKSDNTLWTWGNNAVGPLGDGTKNNRSSPIQIGDAVWATSYAGREITFAIKS